MEAKDEWKWTYIQKLINSGMEYESAIDTYHAGCPHDLDSDPEQTADDEI